MHILLCNERFLFRFGVDRALSLLARGLRERGHRITIMANRVDAAALAPIAERVIVVPEGGNGYLHLNESTASWLDAQWSSLFGELAPDLCLIGGWPFFSSIPVFERHGCRTVFLDCGAVPVEGMSEGARITQEKLRTLRRTHLPQLSAVTPISDFIATTQSMPESDRVPVKTILLGADHMHAALWRGEDLKGTNCSTERFALDRLGEAKDRGCFTILNLGRWEPGCYKNSEAVFELCDGLYAQGLRSAVLVLAEPDLPLPDRYQGKIIPVGFPDDQELLALMAQADLGVSVSLWEGFNLPLAEMQWEGRPVLALQVGAHPEVVADPWYLCDSIGQMVLKGGQLLRGEVPGGANAWQAAVARFQARFAWSQVVDQYDRFLRGLVAPGTASLRVLVDVSNAARDPANSGVIRVTRQLCRALQAYCDPLFVIWTGELGYVLPTEGEYARIASFSGPVIGADKPVSPGPRERLRFVDLPDAGSYAWLLLLETVMETSGVQIRAFARERRLKVGSVFYDAIPLLRPDLVRDDRIRENHAAYMRGLAESALVIPISEFSARCLLDYWREQQLPATEVVPVLLPGEFGTSERNLNAPREPGSPVRMLCVSTLEPRKNHKNLIEAVRLFAAAHPEIDFRLTLVGNRYAGGEAIAEFVEQACREEPRIRWLGIVDDATLHRAYEEASFTIYPSVIEGFGMPILESLWHGRPCLCHQEGVMAELAAGGGCLTVDVTRPELLADAILRLATDRALYRRLAEEAVSRPILGWNSYAGSFYRALVARSDAVTKPQEQAAPAVDSWFELLYPRCFSQGWQMNESERLGLTGVLHRLAPTCAIEIGTYKGGSLSLISQYAKVVFSIDIDPSIPEKFRHFTNVSFLTGRSQQILPMLLRELDEAGMSPAFVLIDGDHSAAGVKRDIEIMLDYVPKRPLVMMMHDGFNPDCRRGMLEAEWRRSPYVHFVDIDFIPGRVIEHGGAGDGKMWGGLALAFLQPQRRAGELTVVQSGRRTFQEMFERHYGAA